jgi:hypothetical protein
MLCIATHHSSRDGSHLDTLKAQRHFVGEAWVDIFESERDKRRSVIDKREKSLLIIGIEHGWYADLNILNRFSSLLRKCHNISNHILEERFLIFFH